MFANGWFTACDGFYGASAYWLSHMKQYTITITISLETLNDFLAYQERKLWLINQKLTKILLPQKPL